METSLDKCIVFGKKNNLMNTCRFKKSLLLSVCSIPMYCRGYMLDVKMCH